MEAFLFIVLVVVILATIIGFVLVVKLFNRQRQQQEILLTLVGKLDKNFNFQQKQLSKITNTLEALPQQAQQDIPKPTTIEPRKPFQVPAKVKEVTTNKVAEFQIKKTAKETFYQASNSRASVQKNKPVSPPPHQPSQFEIVAERTLKEIWNWIIVGEAHRSEGTNMEYAVASNWLLRIGVLVLVTGIGFFLKYSIDSGLLGEQARVALTVLAGLSMIVGAVRLVGGRYHLFAQGLLGGGILVLYFSVFAAFSFYHLLPAYPAFALMILVTASASALAIRLDSMLVAIFAIIGGYCTPILLSTGQVNFSGLYSYMLLLGIGILAINWYKHWHLLNFLSFTFNYILFFGAMGKYRPDYFWEVMPFLTAFFVLYSTMIFLFCLVNKSKSSLLDLLALIINAAIFFMTARYLVQLEYGPTWVAAITISLAVFYIAHTYYCLFKRVADRDLLLCFISLAAFFTAITLPIILSSQWITVSWSLQAVTMLWLSTKLRSAFLQQIAYLLYLIVLFRFCFIDLPDQYNSASFYKLAWSEFLFGLLQRVLSFGIPIASLAAAYFLIKKPADASALKITPNNDVPLLIRNNVLLNFLIIATALILFVVLQMELYRSFGFLYPPLQLPMLTLIWLAMCLLLLQSFKNTQTQWLLVAMQFFVVGVMIKLLFIDLPSWNLTFSSTAMADSVPSLHYRGRYSFQLALMRLLDFATLIGFLLFAYFRLANIEQKSVRLWLGGAALALLFIFLSLEVNSALYQYVPGLRSGGVSILWSVFALSLIFFGIRRQFKIFRMLGLGLFAIVAWKVFFIDLARLEQLYRILAFIILGGLILGGAYFYMRYQHTFISDNSDEKST